MKSIVPLCSIAISSIVYVKGNVFKRKIGIWHYYEIRCIYQSILKLKSLGSFRINSSLS